MISVVTLSRNLERHKISDEKTGKWNKMDKPRVVTDYQTSYIGVSDQILLEPFDGCAIQLIKTNVSYKVFENIQRTQ